MCDNVKVVQDTNYQWAVLDNSGNIIVPFGKFGWIDAFDRGLARVKSIASDHEEIYYFDSDKCETIIAKWGVINEKGEIVLPLEYDTIWNFKDKPWKTIVVVKDGKQSKLPINSLNPSLCEYQVEEVNASCCGDALDYFSITDCYNYDGTFDYDRLEDAIMDGEYVPEDW